MTAPHVEQERDAAERTMRELAIVLSQDAPPVADVLFTLQPRRQIHSPRTDSGICFPTTG